MELRKTVLITGGSSGIGFAFGKIFSRKGYDLVLVARRKKKLEESGNEISAEFHNNILCIASDLSQADSPEHIYKKIQEKGISVDVLVNNAGFGIYGDFAKSDPEEQRNLIQVNISALICLTRLFLPEMIKRKSGKILNTASTAAFQPGPHMATYYASKAYILSFSEALAGELENTGVNVTVLCPGPTKTNFENTAGLGKVRLFKVLSPMSPESVAQAGFEGLMKGRRLIIPGRRNALLAFGNRFVPRSFAAHLSKFILE